MAYHYKKKRYKLKPIPILIAIVILLAVVGFIYFLVKGAGKEQTSSLNQSSEEQISSLAKSSEESSKNQSVNNSKEESSTLSKKDKVSSKDVSSKKPSNSSNTSSENVAETFTTTKVRKEDMWSLVLVNRDNALDGDMNIQKTKFDTQYVDSRAANAYKKMYDAAKKDGITLYLRSGYRSVSTQRVNYNADIQRNLNKGYSKDEAVRLTEQYYARPGESEHHTGLAFDIITPEYHKNVYTLCDKFAQTKAYTWLVNNSANYGFILRYPKDKTNITKINYEAWHYRYVGVEHSKYITINNLCLEEYIERYKVEHPDLF